MPSDGHAFVEASAGTGRTHTIEHLVVDLLVTYGVSLWEVLAIASSERAARALATRLRSSLEEIAAIDATVTRLSAEQCWILNEEAKARIGEALSDFDLASFDTFPSLCRRALAEGPLAAGLPVELEAVGGRDLAPLLAKSLDAPGGAEIAARLRARYRAVLVDDFEEIGAVEWALLDRLFFDAAPQHPMRLVSDPKQALEAHEPVQAAARRRVASRGALVHLSESFRATPDLVRELNRIFDPSVEAPFFEGGRRPERPFTCGRPELRLVGDDGAPRPPVVLLRLPAREPRRALLAHFAEEIERISSRPGERLRFGEEGRERPLRRSDVMVLTRTLGAAEEVVNTLTRLGVESTLYLQEGLFQSREAEQLRDLFAALEDPSNGRKRALAWTTPFFGLPLRKLAGLGLVPPEHPLMKRLADWRGLAVRREWGSLVAQLLEDSGLRRRAVFSGAGERAIANTERILELLLGGGACPSLGELVEALERFLVERGDPGGEDANVMKATSADSVRVLTLPRSKGLEAAVVFVYPFPSERGTDGRESLSAAGKTNELEREASDEAERLLYLGLTRASARLYLPLAPAEKDASSRRASTSTFTFTTPLDRRLSALAAELPVEPVLATPEAPAPRALPASWAPPRELFDLPNTSQAFRGLVARHRGGEVAPEPRRFLQLGEIGWLEGETPAHASAALRALLSEALELVEIDSLRASETFEVWRRRESVQALFARLLVRHGVDRRRRHDVEQRVYGALTRPLALGERRLELGLASSARLLRGVRFVVAGPPTPSGAAGADPGLVEGRFDALFEHDSLVYVATWEAERSGRGSAEDAQLDPRSRRNLAALSDWLGIVSPEDYASRFGGLVRGLAPALGAAATVFDRPSWESIDAIRGELPHEARS